MPNITISESDKSQIDNIFINSSYSGKMLISETPGPTPSAYIINEDLTFEPDESIQMAFISHALSGLSQDGMWCDIKIGDNDIVTFNVQYANMGGDYIYYGTYENSLVGKFIQFSYVDEEPTEGDIRGAIMCMGFDGFSSEEPTTIRVTMRETAQALKTLTLMNGDEIYYTTSAPAGTIISGDEIEAPEPEENYAFVGWYNSDETTEYTFPYTLNDNITMYAVFKLDYSLTLYSHFSVSKTEYPYVVVYATRDGGDYSLKFQILFKKTKPDMTSTGEISFGSNNLYGQGLNSDATTVSSYANIEEIVDGVKDKISTVAAYSGFFPMFSSDSDNILYTNYDLQYEVGCCRYSLIEKPEEPVPVVIDGVIFDDTITIGNSDQKTYWRKFNISNIYGNKRVKYTVDSVDNMLDSIVIYEETPQTATQQPKLICTNNVSFSVLPDRINFSSLSAGTYSVKAQILTETVPYYLVYLTQYEGSYGIVVYSNKFDTQKFAVGSATYSINVDGADIYTGSITIEDTTPVVYGTTQITSTEYSAITTATLTTITLIDANSVTHTLSGQFTSLTPFIGNRAFINIGG